MSKNEITAKKSNETGESFSMEKLIKLASPLMKEWSRGEVEKKKIESDEYIYVFDKNHGLKRYAIRGVMVFLFLIFCLSTFLFISNKDKIAADILMVTITAVISFMGGFGVAKSQVNEEE